MGFRQDVACHHQLGNGSHSIDRPRSPTRVTCPCASYLGSYSLPSTFERRPRRGFHVALKEKSSVGVIPPSALGVGVCVFLAGARRDAWRGSAQGEHAHHTRLICFLEVSSVALDQMTNDLGRPVSPKPLNLSQYTR